MSPLDYDLNNYHELFDNSYNEEEEINNCVNCGSKILLNEKYCDEICQRSDKLHKEEYESNSENEMRSRKLLYWYTNNCSMLTYSQDLRRK